MSIYDDIAGVAAVTIPDGSVKKITRKADSVVIWEKPVTETCAVRIYWYPYYGGVPVITYRSAGGQVSFEPTYEDDLMETTIDLECVVGTYIYISGDEFWFDSIVKHSGEPVIEVTEPYRKAQILVTGECKFIIYGAV